jgi:[ribosomal protein S5]-alanine N-acetyltransferase
MTQLETPRLTLLALNLKQLETYTSDLPALCKELDIPILGDPGQPDVARAIRLKLEIMQSLPETERPWVTYWLIILRQERVGAGLLGFKGQPDDLGQVEIGYGMDGGYQNKGYMTEAVRSLAGWAFQQPTCRTITAEVYHGNNASIRVLQKLGARLVNRDSEKALYQLTSAEWAAVQPE